MSKFEVELVEIVHYTRKVIVEADDRDRAEDKAWDEFRAEIGDISFGTPTDQVGYPWDDAEAVDWTSIVTEVRDGK